MGEVSRSPAPGRAGESWEGGQWAGRKPSGRYLRSQPGWLARPLSSESWSLQLPGAHGNRAAFPTRVREFQVILIKLGRVIQSHHQGDSYDALSLRNFPSEAQAVASY